jgi:hypothetical protein
MTIRSALDLILPPRFPLGPVFVSPGVRALADDKQIGGWLLRHRQCDWGVCPDEDRASHESAIALGYGRVMSAYPIDPTQICRGHGKNTVWVLTRFHDELAETTVLLPDEY